MRLRSQAAPVGSRRTAVGSRTFLIVTLVAAFAAMTATASAEYLPKGSFSGPGSENGKLSTPGRAAAEQSTGNLFVVDSGNDRVQVFKPNAAGRADYLAQFGNGELSDPWGIAIDEDGGQTYVYVADAGNDRIVKYVSDGAAHPSFSVDASFASPAEGAAAGQVGDFHAALAVDPTSHDLLVADNANKRIDRFEADGTPAGSFDGTAGSGSPGAFAGPIDVAVNSAGDVYVIDANGSNIAEQEGTSQVLRYTGAGEYEATLGPVGSTERPATVAVNPRNDEVIVTGDQDAVYETAPEPFVPVIQRFDAANSPLPSPQINEEAIYDSVSGIAIAAGSADHLYVVLDIGHYFGEPYGLPQIQAFRQGLPGKPAVLDTSAMPTLTEATLGATINPQLLATTYRFEYGPTSSYGQVTEDRTLPAEEAELNVSAQIRELSPSTGYHFRVVAENSAGRVEGPDSTLVTTAPPGVDTCANAAIRTIQRAQTLSDCRAYEQVSPLEKNGTDVNSADAIWGPFQVGPGGDSVAYTSNGAFADPQSSFVGIYVASRGGDWSSRSIVSPIAATSPFGSFNGYTPFIAPDFSKTLVVSAAGLAGEPAGTYRLYLQDTVSDSYRSITPYPAGVGSGTIEAMVAGASADFSHLLVQSPVPLTPDSPPGRNIYEWVDGSPPSFRLAGILPDDQAAPGGAAPGAVGPTGQGIIHSAMSADGSHVFFNSPPGSGNLYMRVGGIHTTQISAAGRFEGATRDGSRVLFIDSAGLELYETAGGEKTNLTPDSEPLDGSSPEVSRVVAASDDFSRVYFVSRGQLLPEGGLPGGPNLYLTEGGTVSFVATLHPQKGEWPADLLEQAFGPSAASSRAVTADGSRLAFVSMSKLTSYNNAGFPELYVYDAPSGRISCPSCAGGSGWSELVATQGRNHPPTRLSHSIQWEQSQQSFSADGSRLFFSTSKALVPEDANGVADVYEWRNGTVRLISSGTGEQSIFLGASASGDDVFFATRNQLVAQDTDRLNDIYDARAGGGILAQNPEPPANQPCAGDACRNVTAPPMAPGLASRDLRGGGNAVHKPGKKKRAKKKHGKHRKKKRTGKGRHGKKKGAQGRKKHRGKKKRSGPGRRGQSGRVQRNDGNR